MVEFKLERYFSKYEFNSKYLLCSSDCEPLSMGELLNICDTPVTDLLGISLGYTTSMGDFDLRKEIAGLYGRVNAGQVMTFAGAQEAIYVFFRSMLQAGDEVIVQFPCYQSLYSVAENIGCTIKYWKMDPHNGWQLDLNELQTLVTTRTRCIVINFPNNPTGSVISAEDLQEIISIAAKQHIYILSDEVYRFLAYDTTLESLPICDLYEFGVSVGVMSKSFGLPGLRLGWVASQSATILTKMNVYKDYTSLCNNVFGEFLSTIALRNRQKILQRNLDILKSNLCQLKHFLNEHRCKLQCTIPAAGSVAFIRLQSSISTMQFCQEIHREKSLFILPSETFNLPSGYLRIGIGRSSFSSGLAVLGEYLNSNSNI